MRGKVSLEDHFVTADFAGEIPDYVNPQAMAEINRRLLDLDDARLADMDAAGIEIAVLSHTSPGIQAALLPVLGTHTGSRCARLPAPARPDPAKGDRP